MVFNKNGRKRRHPYASLAVFSLAAAGVIGIFNKGKRFVKEKASSISSMVKGMKPEQ